MNDNKTITLYNYVIIQQYKTKNKLIQLNYTREIVAKSPATMEGVIKLQEIDNEIKATTDTLQRYNEAYERVSKELFGNDIIEQATTIINGGNM